MKFLVFSGFGGDFIPDVLEPIMAKHPFPENRYSADTIDFIEKAAKPTDEPNKLAHDEIGYVFDGTEKTYYAYYSGMDIVISFTIKEITQETKKYELVDFYGERIVEFAGMNTAKCELVDAKCGLYREL